jgi:non-ribosomal peptide synthetase component F
MPEQTFDGASQTRVVPEDLVPELEHLALSQRSTLFMVMLAAFKVLLHRYTGVEDILVGVPVAGRTHVETEPLIGFFVNTLVLRTGVSGDVTFRDFLSRVRDVTLGALAHAEVPFVTLVEELRPRRSLSFNPVFQVMFAAVEAAAQVSSFGALTAGPYGIETRRSRFDLSASVIEGPNSQRWVQFEYNTTLFDGDRIDRMLGHYLNVLRAVVSNPASRIANLSLLDDEERRRLLVEFNNTEVAFPPDSCADP